MRWKRPRQTDPPARQLTPIPLRDCGSSSRHKTHTKRRIEHMLCTHLVLKPHTTQAAHAVPPQACHQGQVGRHTSQSLIPVCPTGDNPMPARQGGNAFHGSKAGKASCTPAPQPPQNGGSLFPVKNAQKQGHIHAVGASCTRVLRAELCPLKMPCAKKGTNQDRCDGHAYP